MRNWIKYILSFVFVPCSYSSFAQQNNARVDSLLILLKTDKEDTSKADRLLQLADIYSYQNADSAIYYAGQSKNVSEKINDNKRVANALSELGWGNYIKGNYAEALEHYFKALALDEKFKDKNGSGKRFSNIGNVYRSQGDFPKALTYFLKSLKINEELHNKAGVARDLGNIGIVYAEQADHPKALEYYFRALKMAEEIGFKQLTVNTLSNIGVAYKKLGDLSKALEYYFLALKLKEELGDKNGIATQLANIGSIYHGQARIVYEDKIASDSLCKKALHYCFKALEISEQIGNKYLIASSLGNIGSVYTELKKYAEAEKYLLDALKISQQIGASDYERQSEELLTELFTKANKHQLALEHYKKAMALKDTIFNEEKNKEITRKQMTFDFEKKETATKAEQDKKDTVTQLIIYSVSAGFALVLLLAVFIFRGYRQKQKANIIISQQKHLVEEKQKNILDSIHYAKRIQQSLLPTEKYIDKSLTRLKRK